MICETCKQDRICYVSPESSGYDVIIYSGKPTPMPKATNVCKPCYIEAYRRVYPDINTANLETQLQ